VGRQYYDEPKYDLMKKFIHFQMKIQRGQTFTENEFVKKFIEKYPLFKKSGIVMSLSRLSVNDPNRERYNPKKRDDFLWKVNGHTYRLYDKTNDVVGVSFVDNNVKKKPYGELIKNDKTQNNISSSEPYEKIVQEAKELIRLINQNCKNLGKVPIFKESELFELLIDIEKICTSKEGFEVFSSSLYKLVVENPRDKNPNFKKTGGHFYEYRYSKYSIEFWKDNTITKDFIDDVKTIRHEFAHTKLEKKTPVKTKAEVLQKYLGSNIEPRLLEKYQEFQFGVLKEFVSFLNKLLEMVENYKPSSPRKPLTS
jgi:hypothetical protein